MAIKDWKRRASPIAARVFFCIIFFQVPLFRSPCPSSVCTSPIQFLSSGLIANVLPIQVSSPEFAIEIFPSPMVKAFLYPGAIVNGIVRNMTVPRWGDLLDIYNMTTGPEAPKDGGQFWAQCHVAGGSYYCISGAIMGILKGHMNPIGTPALIYGLYKGGQLQQEQANTDPATAVYVYPTMLIAFICQFLVVCWPNRKDMSTKSKLN